MKRAPIPFAPPMESLPMSMTLPQDARAMLVSATSVEPRVPRAESKVRIRALEQAIQRVRLKYPQYFQN